MGSLAAHFLFNVWMCFLLFCFVFFFNRANYWNWGPWIVDAGEYCSSHHRQHHITSHQLTFHTQPHTKQNRAKPHHLIMWNKESCSLFSAQYVQGRVSVCITTTASTWVRMLWYQPVHSSRLLFAQAPQIPLWSCCTLAMRWLHSHILPAAHQVPRSSTTFQINEQASPIVNAQSILQSNRFWCKRDKHITAWKGSHVICLVSLKSMDTFFAWCFKLWSARSICFERLCYIFACFGLPVCILLFWFCFASS